MLLCHAAQRDDDFRPRLREIELLGRIFVTIVEFNGGSACGSLGIRWWGSGCPPLRRYLKVQLERSA